MAKTIGLFEAHFFSPHLICVTYFWDRAAAFTIDCCSRNSNCCFCWV